MKLSVEFAWAASEPGGGPRWKRAEMALAGRSNVGKSSLLNALAGVRGLARTSKTPGRTRTINFFALGDSAALVDLPGYGYAKMSQVEARKIARLMEDYLARRKNLAGLVLLIDARRGPGEQELALAEMVRSRGGAVVVAATKSDKLRRSERLPAMRKFAVIDPDPVFCSTLDGEGIAELRRRVLQCLAAAEHLE